VISTSIDQFLDDDDDDDVFLTIKAGATAPLT